MTIFSVQRFLEDHFERRGLTDVDQYAVRVANTFERLGSRVSDNRLAAELRRVRTAFFRRNQDLNRKEFELQLAAALRRRFKKKLLTMPRTILSEDLPLLANGFAHSIDLSGPCFPSLSWPSRPAP